MLYTPRVLTRYIGYTADLVNRILSHNELGTNGYTLKYRPWVIVHTDEFETKTEAIKRERQLKSAKGRVFIRHIIKEKFDSSAN